MRVSGIKLGVVDGAGEGAGMSGLLGVGKLGHLAREQKLELAVKRCDGIIEMLQGYRAYQRKLAIRVELGEFEPLTWRERLVPW